MIFNRFKYEMIEIVELKIESNFKMIISKILSISIINLWAKKQFQVKVSTKI